MNITGLGGIGAVSNNTITYTKSTLKMVEKIDGIVTTKKFKTLKDMLEDKFYADEYIKESKSRVKTILK
jgi:hypothetical protein